MQGLTFSDGPRVDSSDVLHITAIFENVTLEPTDIQVWQFPEKWRRDCPTDKPIAFISPKRSGTEWYPWSSCVVEGASKYAKSTLEVPWVAIDDWNYAKRHKGTTVWDDHQPTYWDWHVRVDLGYHEVYRLEVDYPIGYLVIIHSGDVLLAREWIDY